MNDGLIQDAGPKAEVFERLRAATTPAPAVSAAQKKTSPVQTVTWKP
jgi:hypothetical protein